MRLIDADELKNFHSINKGDFNTVESIQKWIDKAPTIRVRGEKKKKEPYIPPCIEPGALDGINMQVIELPGTPVFDFKPIKPRKKEPDPLEEYCIDLGKIQEAYDKLVWELTKAGYKLALQQAREAIEAEIGKLEDPIKSTKTTGLLRARSIIREMEKR